ncbi:hypothetical protein ACFYUR_19005 [Micromonospora haikouensis]|uniref:hypothetical protein n=1 Tax=Micromonospora haikouensis TaxID=686309 RepID=UPI00369EBE17
MTALADVAWVVDHDVNPADPDLPEPIAHRITLTGGVLACAPWITAAAGRRITETQARNSASMCPHCWPDPKGQ